MLSRDVPPLPHVTHPHTLTPAHPPFSTPAPRQPPADSVWGSLAKSGAMPWLKKGKPTSKVGQVLKDAANTNGAAKDTKGSLFASGAKSMVIQGGGRSQAPQTTA